MDSDIIHANACSQPYGPHPARVPSQHGEEQLQECVGGLVDLNLTVLRHPTGQRHEQRHRIVDRSRVWVRVEAGVEGADSTNNRALAGEKARRLKREGEVRRYGREALLALVLALPLVVTMMILKP